VRNVQIAGLALSFAACAARTAGVSCSGFERHRHEPRRRPQRRVGENRFLQPGKVRIDERAEIRQRTARVDEREQRRRSAPLRERASLVRLVDQSRVGDDVADSEDAFGHQGRVRVGRERLKAGASDGSDAPQGLGDFDRPVDQLSGLPPLQQGRILHRKAHRHPGISRRCRHA
jgi:hypothetical protein